MRTKRLRGIFLLVLIWLCQVSHSESLIQNVDGLLYGGAYSLSGESSSNRSVNLSGVGAYLAQVDLSFKDRFRTSFGVNYLLSDGFGGDSAWGINAGVKYFPWSLNGKKEKQFNGIEIYIVDQFRPYVGLNFKNLQFTAILSTTYAGLGGVAGLHYVLTQNLYLVGEAQYNMLTGNSENSLTEINFLFGIGFGIK